MRFLFRFLPERWRLPFVIFAGLLGGLVLTLMYVSNFFSYLSDSPKTCVNCHIMGPQYATWFHSAHREYATCNDCHVPQDNVFHTYYFKAMDGLRHSTLFTLKMEEQAITIKNAGKIAVQNNCKRCHQNAINEIAAMNFYQQDSKHPEERRCWECHKTTPHGKVRSLSATPYARVPTTGSMIPDWLKKVMDKERIENSKSEKKKD